MPFSCLSRFSSFDLMEYLTLHGSPQWALELLRELELEQLGEKHQAVTHNRLGILHQHFGEYDNALACFEKALEIDEKLEDSKGIASNLHQIGIIHQMQGHYDDALRQYEKSLEIREKIGDTKGIAESLHQIGRIYEEKGHYDDALRQYEKSLEIKEKIGNIDGMAISMGQMGKLYFEKEEFFNALKLCLQSFVIFVKLGSPNSEIVKKTINRINQKMPTDQFHAVLKEFNLEPGIFDAKETETETEDPQKQLMEFLTAITSEAVSAGEKTSEEKEKLAAQLNQLIDQLTDDPKAVGIKSYFQLLLACVNGSDYQQEMEKIPKELKELFEKSK